MVSAFLSKERGTTHMKQHQAASSVVKGLAAGAVVGAASYMMSTAGKKKLLGHAVKKNTGKALKAVGSVLDNVSTMMK